MFIFFALSLVNDGIKTLNGLRLGNKKPFRGCLLMAIREISHMRKKIHSSLLL